ncbi:SnoaL-like protein [Geodermatophilus tzadiensis]|uniref:SnoaL-like protein n=1 Tax=Geodermatophilus tzadiensis TaxID=1137988 RepID=A0A2T0U052_9ACTN|nr:nuclear transport factor 2 family protein [Geodermatophilus tzadiensis]PRY51297.1 SnoaL-like protein [Geodermatophilus tzadiensis]
MTPPREPGAPEDVVRGFLLDVRSGARPDRVHRYLAPRVQAHQGPPGAVHAVVERSPGQYAAHVQEMQRAVGPWTFEVLGVTAAAAGRVEAAWRQSGAAGTGGSPGRRVVEHGRATYLVEDGRITQYWIDARQEVLP